MTDVAHTRRTARSAATTDMAGAAHFG